MSNVEHPKHYQECSIECIEAMIIAYGEDVVYDFCKCNAFKYLWRYKTKGGVESLDKGLWYCKKAQELDKSSAFEYDNDDIERIKKIIETHKKKYIKEMGLLKNV